MQRGEYVKAVKHFNKAMGMAPSDEESQELDRLIKTAKKKYNKARGLFAMKKGNYVTAVEHFNIAMRQDPSEEELKELKGLINTATKDLEAVTDDSPDPVREPRPGPDRVQL